MCWELCSGLERQDDGGREFSGKDHHPRGMTNDSCKGCGYEKVKRNVLRNLEQGDEERLTQAGCIELHV